MSLQPGDYAVVTIRESSGHTMRASAVARTTLTEHAELSGSDIAAAEVRAAADATMMFRS